MLARGARAGDPAGTQPRQGGHDSDVERQPQEQQHAAAPAPWGWRRLHRFSRGRRRLGDRQLHRPSRSRKAAAVGRAVGSSAGLHQHIHQLGHDVRQSLDGLATQGIDLDARRDFALRRPGRPAAEQGVEGRRQRVHIPVLARGCRSSTSGAAYAGVSASKASARSASGSGMIAKPKSARPACSYESIRMFAGLTSRCSTPRACAAASASAIRTPRSRTRCSLRRFSGLSQEVSEPPGAQLHHQIRPLVSQNAGVVDGDDAGVTGHPACRAGLAQEATLLRLGLQRALVDLDRNPPVERVLPGLPHGSEATTGQGSPVAQPRDCGGAVATRSNLDAVHARVPVGLTLVMSTKSYPRCPPRAAPSPRPLRRRSRSTAGRNRSGSRGHR